MSEARHYTDKQTGTVGQARVTAICALRVSPVHITLLTENVTCTGCRAILAARERDSERTQALKGVTVYEALRNALDFLESLGYGSGDVHDELHAAIIRLQHKHSKAILDTLA